MFNHKHYISLGYFHINRIFNFFNAVNLYYMHIQYQFLKCYSSHDMFGIIILDHHQKSSTH